MIAKKIIALVFLLMYAFIIFHDILPHHHHNGQEYVQFSDKLDDSDQSCNEHAVKHQCSHDKNDDCSDSNKCNFPFHQHDNNEAGTYLASENEKISFSETALQVIYSVYLDLELNTDDQIEFFDQRIPVYKKPILSSYSLRGPPIS